MATLACDYDNSQVEYTVADHCLGDPLLYMQLMAAESLDEGRDFFQFSIHPHLSTVEQSRSCTMCALHLHSGGCFVVASPIRFICHHPRCSRTVRQLQKQSSAAVL